MKAYGYVRVSTDEQENSVQAQIESIRSGAKKEDVELAEIFIDKDVSGSVPLRNRPQGRLLWDRMDRGDILFFSKVDRVFRSVADAAATVMVWQDKGIRVIILDLGIDLATAAGRMFFHQLSSFAEFEREMISQRLKDIFAHLRTQGRLVGRPYGWGKRDGKWVEDTQERELAQRVAGMRRSGMSLRRIFGQLWNERVSKPGRTWDPTKKGTMYSPYDLAVLAFALERGFPIASPSSLRDELSALRLPEQASRTSSRSASLGLRAACDLLQSAGPGATPK